MAQEHITEVKTKSKAKPKTPGTASTRKPSQQALQAADVAVGAVPQAADAVGKTVDQLRDKEARSQELKTLQHRVKNLRDSNTRDAQIKTLKQNVQAEIDKAERRGGEIRRQVSDQVVERARKTRARVEPVYRNRVEPTVKNRVEPVYRNRVEPTVKRVEPTVKRALERV